eukprot:TRINITY_DN112585_c0_g1_i1.p1 TRINITY_DN112585_c0_g1~~TRINITY_DN112585_c0_g1_i1.p1  ORF type:complete len:574 (-),score=147.65 TRINITY_DN112585_c0_g1_i1:230-1951(-)
MVFRSNAIPGQSAGKRRSRGVVLPIAVAALGSVALLSQAGGQSERNSFMSPSKVARQATATAEPTTAVDHPPPEITEKEPLRVLVAGAGVGGLAMANAMKKNKHVKVSVLEREKVFARFGGPIQLASNAMATLRHIDENLYSQIEGKATWTGNLTNGIKDGIRDEWYAMFDLKNPAAERQMPFTCVVERPDLQAIMLGGLDEGIVRNEAQVMSYEQKTPEAGGGVIATLENGKKVHGDVLIGADGIWSAVRAQMHNNERQGDNSGASYSGYTVYAGELDYKAPDNGEVGYKVFIGPSQYFVVTDIGKGRYQWYAFLAKPVGTAKTEADLKPTEAVDGCAAGNPAYLRNVFDGWSKDILNIIRATRDDEIQQRDLYDRPPSVNKPWNDHNVALLGDAVHAMMPNLGQGGCQAIEDALVLTEELGALKDRLEVPHALERYRSRRLIRSAATQGLSRFASDIIIRGFDTPAKITEKGIENFNYAGVVTRLLQPILPTFFSIQFTFLYGDWKNKFSIDPIGLLIALFGGFFLVAFAAVAADTSILAFVGLESLVVAGEGGAASDAAATVAANLDTLL